MFYTPRKCILLSIHKEGSWQTIDGLPTLDLSKKKNKNLSPTGEPYMIMNVIDYTFNLKSYTYTTLFHKFERLLNVKDAFGIEFNRAEAGS